MPAPSERRLKDPFVSRFSEARLLAPLTLTPAGFLLDRRDAESYSLNPTAMRIIAALERGCPPGEIYRELVAEFEVEPLVARLDVERFLSRLYELKLLALSPEKAADE